MVRRQKREQEKLGQVRGTIAGASPQQAAVKPYTVALSRAEDSEPSLSNLYFVKLAAAKVLLGKARENCPVSLISSRQSPDQS